MVKMTQNNELTARMYKKLVCVHVHANLLSNVKQKKKV